MLSLLKFTLLFAGSAYAIFGGRLSFLPPVGGRSSAQEVKKRTPIGRHLGATSKTVKRSNAISISSTVSVLDFPGFESTETFILILSTHVNHQNGNI